MANRLTQAAIEALVGPSTTANARVTQSAVEALIQVTAIDPNQPISGTAGTLVFDLATKGWIAHSYAVGDVTSSSGGVSLHYQPGKILDLSTISGAPAETDLYRPATACGNNGCIYRMIPGIGDDGASFVARVVTPFDDQGESRARKQYGDLMLDYRHQESSDASFAVSVLYDNSTSPSAGWTPPVAATRGQSLCDLGLDVESLHRNIALDVQFTPTGGVWLYEWQPSFFVTPEDTGNRPTDWTDCGSPHYKFVHGLRIDADTGGVARTVQLQYDGGQVGATLTVNHNGEMVKPYSFPPFKAHLVRLVPNDAANWRLFSVEYDVDPEPDATSYWVSQPSTFDMPGFLHIRDLQFAYATDTAGGALNVIVDGVTYTLVASLPVTGMAESKLYVPAPPIKGKLWQLEAIGTNLQVYERDCEFRIKPWGADAYQVLKPLGDTTRSSGGARI